MAMGGKMAEVTVIRITMAMEERRMVTVVEATVERRTGKEEATKTMALRR